MRSLLVVFCFLVLGQCFSQDPIQDEKTFDERYARNIKKSRINGVYIPKNLDEAIEEIKALSTEGSLDKFKEGDEVIVSRKLHFGVGRWMIYNWNLYEGSRFSHSLKEKGLTHPDDQARLVIVSLHRQLNDKELDVPEQIKSLQDARAIERNKQVLVLKEETRIRQNEPR